MEHGAGAGLAPDAASAKRARAGQSCRWPESGASEAPCGGPARAAARSRTRCAWSWTVRRSGVRVRAGSSRASTRWACCCCGRPELWWSAGTGVGGHLARRTRRAGRARGTAARTTVEARPRGRRQAGRAPRRPGHVGRRRTGRMAGRPDPRGSAGLERERRAALRTVAARMVDAQAPGLASGLRRAAGMVGRGRDWPSRVLDELSLLYLLAAAGAGWTNCPSRWPNRPHPARVPLRDSRVLARASRWSTPGWSPAWSTRRTRAAQPRVWLRGQRTGRCALVLSFAPPGRPLDGSLLPGSLVPAGAGLLPGCAAVARARGRARHPLGAACPARATRSRPRWPAYAGRWPPIRGWIAGRCCWPVVPASARRCAARCPMWTVTRCRWCRGSIRGGCCAVSAGGPVTRGGRMVGRGLRPLSCWDGDRAVRL